MLRNDITALGEVLIDMTQSGTDALGNGVFTAYPGGAPANVAVAAARLGAKCGFIGKAGKDSFGRSLAETLEKEGIDIWGELYNDFEALQDARLCGTTASLCGIEASLYERNEPALQTGIAADLMLHALVFTLSGIPVLYSGDEIGMLNDYGYHNDPEKAADSRFIHRGVFDWELSEQRHQEGTPASQIFHGLSDLTKIRKSSKLFRSDASLYAVETGNDHVLGIGRTYKDQQFLALFNFVPEYSQVYLEIGSWKDLIDENKEVSPQLEPYGFRWLVRSV